ncbi:MAG: hypothetical protein ACKKMO_02175 [Candidatus Nealsonbacteria bacterium]
MTKDVFFRHYANLPLAVRREVVLDLGEKGGPITWEVAYREIKADTKLGDEIFKKLIELKFIPTEDENKSD